MGEIKRRKTRTPTAGKMMRRWGYRILDPPPTPPKASHIETRGSSPIISGIKRSDNFTSQLTINPSPTQYDFITSQELENCIMGPRGEGKTEAGIMAMTFHATQQPEDVRPIPWAIIRDTWTNLERTTLQSFLAPRPKSFAYSLKNMLITRNGGRDITLPGYWKAYLFGVDSPSDLSQLQSMQLGGLWLEEAAPAAIETIGIGVSEETWAIGISSLRHPCTYRRAQITMNYPDEDHWTWQRFHDRSVGKLFRIPRGENRHVDDAYRHNMEAALASRPDLLARLVMGKPANVQVGEAVTPEYDEMVHRARVVLEPLPNTQVIRCWDGGLNPACVFAQITPSGKVHILDTVRGVNIGMRQLIEAQVKPLINMRYTKVSHWMDTGDPNLNTPEQSDSYVRAAMVIEDALGGGFVPGEPSWDARREVVKEMLVRQQIVVSLQDNIMHRALSGGWHYYKDATGKVIKDKPVKDLHSHPADAFTHAMARIFPRYRHEPMPTVAETRFSVFKPNYAVAR